MGVHLDWSDPSRWANPRRPCVHCGGATNLRTADGRPAHKVCLERLLDQQRRQRRHLHPVTGEAS